MSSGNCWYRPISMCPSFGWPRPVRRANSLNDIGTSRLRLHPLDGDVFAWGLAFDDHTLLCGDDRRSTGTSTHPEQAVRLFARAGRRLRLLWLD
ncbi:hypothetical protein ABT336_08080 [Micromonospora sp. NPDC000207]|uniref:hypothetical protein n=1 Tax=Micromonospora sp. NPDC000207 TaxID=3154246 RepID=UPI0033277C98